MITERKRNRLLIIAAVLTLLFSFLPSFHMDSMLGVEYSLGFDMLQHGGYYFALSLFLIYINNGERRWAIWFILIDISILLEICQNIIPGRTFSWYDILANVIGTTLGTLIWYIVDWRQEELRRKRRRRRRSRHRSSRHYSSSEDSEHRGERSESHRRSHRSSGQGSSRRGSSRSGSDY